LKRKIGLATTKSNAAGDKWGKKTDPHTGGILIPIDVRQNAHM
jgi:hypothetical protein